MGIPAIIESVLVIVQEFLKLKILKEQTKYEDQIISIKKDLRNEFGKPVWDGKDVVTDASHFRNDAQLYELLSQLCEVANAITTAPRNK